MAKEYFDSWDAFDADAAEAAVDDVKDDTEQHAKDSRRQPAPQKTPAATETDRPDVADIARKLGVDPAMLHATAHALSLTREQIDRMPEEARHKVQAVREGAGFAELRRAVHAIGLDSAEARAALQQSMPAELGPEEPLENDMLRAVAQALSISDEQLRSLPQEEQNAVRAVREDPRFANVRRQVAARVQRVPTHHSNDGSGGGFGTVGNNVPSATNAEPDWVAMMDYSFVDGCSDEKLLRGVLERLRSGEYGEYPDLVTHTERKLDAITAREPQTMPEHETRARAPEPSPGPAKASRRPGSRLRVGMSVEFQGLKKRSDLNGTTGVIEAFVKQSSRWKVRCDQDGEACAFKAANLIAADSSEAAGAGSEENLAACEHTGGDWVEVGMPSEAESVGQARDETLCEADAAGTTCGTDSTGAAHVQDTIDADDGGHVEAEHEALDNAGLFRVAVEIDGEAGNETLGSELGSAPGLDVEFEVEDVTCDDGVDRLRVCATLPFLQSMRGVQLSIEDEGQELQLSLGAKHNDQVLAVPLPRAVDGTAPVQAHFSKKKHLLTLTLTLSNA